MSPDTCIACWHASARRPKGGGPQSGLRVLAARDNKGLGVLAKKKACEADADAGPHSAQRGAHHVAGRAKAVEVDQIKEAAQAAPRQQGARLLMHQLELSRRAAR